MFYYKEIKMIGKGFFREQFQPRTCSRLKTPRADQVKGNCINGDLIDVDSDQVSDVVIIDEPEFVEGKLHGSSVPRRDRKCPLPSVISIDDDDSDDAYHPGNIAEGGEELDSDASSSKRFSPAPSFMRNRVVINVDDCHVVKEKAPASHLPKSMQLSSAKAADRSCGLDGSESGSSESDCSDCELLGVREEWEKAWVKRKQHVVNDRAGFDEQESSSGFCSTIYTDIGVENRTGLHAGSPVEFGPCNGKCVKDNLYSFYDVGDSHMSVPNCNLGAGNSCKCSDQNSDPQCSESRRDYFSSSTKYRSHNFAGDVTGNSRFRKEMGCKESKYMGSNVEESERQVDNNGSLLKNKDGNFFEAHSNYASFDKTSANQDGFVSQQSCDWWHNSGLGADGKNGPAPEDSLFCKPQSFGKSRVSNCSEVEVTADSEVVSVQRNTLCSDLQHKQDRSCLVENEKPSDIGDALHVPHDAVANLDGRDILNKREKLKETEDYKRTMEEEWASRRRQLQIQAEEAQRLRKRKKAESMRLLEMRRRQKERIEEVRETKKKDEENMNMKEQLRVEMKKGLNKLETTCVDMASLLRCLGIQVGGGLNPLPHEVRAAYKRALLKFHPDRVSKSDIGEQVEAEEKFKLISRMKDKLLPSSSC